MRAMYENIATAPTMTAMTTVLRLACGRHRSESSDCNMSDVSKNRCNHLMMGSMPEMRYVGRFGGADAFVAGMRWSPGAAIVLDGGCHMVASVSFVRMLVGIIHGE